MRLQRRQLATCRQPLHSQIRARDKLRSIGIRDYSVLEGRQRVGRIRFAEERMPPIWLWNINIHLTGGLPMDSSKDLDTAKADFKAAWEELKARVSREQLAAAFADMNFRDEG